MYHRSVGTTVTTPPVMRVADTNVFLSTDFWCCLPECFFQLCGELAYLMVFCLPLPLSSGVLLDFVCYIIELTLLTPITMFYCLKFLSVSEDTTLTCSSWRFVCRSKSLFDIVPVFFGFSLIISLRGSLRAEKRSPNSNWKSVFFTLFAACSLLSWWCRKRVHFNRTYYTTLCFLRGWTMHLFELWIFQDCSESPFHKMVKYGIWLKL